jgi:hypothetical protein
MVKSVNKDDSTGRMASCGATGSSTPSSMSPPPRRVELEAMNPGSRYAVLAL